MPIYNSEDNNILAALEETYRAMISEKKDSDELKSDKANLRDKEDRYITSPHRIRNWKGWGAGEREKPYDEHPHHEVKKPTSKKDGVIKFSKWAKYDDETGEKSRNRLKKDAGVQKSYPHHKHPDVMMTPNNHDHPDQSIAPHGSKRSWAREKRHKNIASMKKMAGGPGSNVDPRRRKGPPPHDDERLKK